MILEVLLCPLADGADEVGWGNVLDVAAIQERQKGRAAKAGHCVRRAGRRQDGRRLVSGRAHEMS